MEQTFNPKQYVGKRFRYNHLCSDNDIEVLGYTGSHMIVADIDYHKPDNPVKEHAIFKVSFKRFQRALLPDMDYHNLVEIDNHRNDIKVN